jgi:hypothetical protein
MNYLYKTAFVFFTSLCLLTSCKKFVEIAPPPNQLETTAVFSDSTSASAAITGIYIAMMQNFALSLTSGGLSVYCGMSADELLPTTKMVEEEDFYYNSIIPGNSINYSNFWSLGYKFIYQVNACIEGINKSGNLSSSTKAKLAGEASFLRAFLNFYLTNLYGPIPLPLSTDYRINMKLPRSPADLVYNRIMEDLKLAESSLPIAYPSTGRFRPNLYTVRALQARVLLYQQKWNEAENAANTVINSGIYSLEPDLNKVFLATSNEAIWKLSPVVESKETWEGYYIIPSNTSTVPKYCITSFLLNAFEQGDKRKSAWINKNVVNGLSWYYPYKYKLRTTTASPIENYVVFRLAELFLIRAEARAQQNNVEGAIKDINLVRTRGGLANLSSTVNKEQVLAAIFQERRVELFAEWGHRWFDLKRTGEAGKLLQPIKQDWNSTDILYPIPDTEIETNPNLIQNPGY